MSDTNEPSSIVIPGEYTIILKVRPGALAGHPPSVHVDMGGLSPVTVANIFCGFSAQVLTQLEQQQQQDAMRAAQMQTQGIIAPTSFRKN